MKTARNVTTTPACPPFPSHRPLFAGEDAAAYDSLLRGARGLHGLAAREQNEECNRYLQTEKTNSFWPRALRNDE